MKKARKEIDEAKILRRTVLATFGVILILFACLAGGAYYIMFGLPRGTANTEDYVPEPKLPASYEYEDDSFKYVIDRIQPKTIEEDITEKIRITEYTGESTHVEIPRYIKGIEVYSITNSCFYENDAITSVEISSTITEIQAYAFYKCSNLKDVKFIFKDSPLTIKDHAFYGCPIESLNFIQTKLDIGDLAFAECTSLKKLTFNSNCILKIGVNAFRHTSLESVDIPYGTTEIASMAFSNCYNLKNLKLPNNDDLKVGKDVTKQQPAYIYEMTDRLSVEPIEGLTQPNTTKKTTTVTTTTEVEDTTEFEDEEDPTGEHYVVEPETRPRRKGLIERIMEQVLA